MKYLTQLLAVATATTALAVPESLTKRADTQFEDTFDDLSTTIVLPQLFPVGDYHGLAYGGVVVLVRIDRPILSLTLFPESQADTESSDPSMLSPVSKLTPRPSSLVPLAPLICCSWANLR